MARPRPKGEVLLLGHHFCPEAQPLVVLGPGWEVCLAHSSVEKTRSLTPIPLSTHHASHSISGRARRMNYPDGREDVLGRSEGQPPGESFLTRPLPYFPSQVLDLKEKVRLMRRFWTLLPHTLCSSEKAAAGMANEDSCWNGQTRGRWGSQRDLAWPEVGLVR